MTATTWPAEVIVVGGGQAGLTAGYYLARAGDPVAGSIQPGQAHHAGRRRIDVFG